MNSSLHRALLGAFLLVSIFVFAYPILLKATQLSAARTALNLTEFNTQKLKQNADQKNSARTTLEDSIFSYEEHLNGTAESPGPTQNELQVVLRHCTQDLGGIQPINTARVATGTNSAIGPMRRTFLLRWSSSETQIEACLETIVDASPFLQIETLDISRSSIGDVALNASMTISIATPMNATQ